jgi:hypothetical protein
MKSQTPQSQHSQRFTVSVPRYLFEIVEHERELLHMGRSGFVAALFGQFHEQQEKLRRAHRYRRAYGEHPLSSEEESLSDYSTEVLAASVE